MEKRSIDKKYLDKVMNYGLQDMILDSCLCLHFQAGETVVQEGQPILWLGIVLDGRAKICSTAPNGNHLVLSHYISDGMLGDVEFVANLETYIATITAITEFTYLAIPYRGFEAQLKENTVFLNKLATGMAEKLINSSANYISAALCSGEERLCRYILQSTHKDLFTDVLADTSCSVGISYRHMFRLLSDLCGEGILEKKESGYRILDRKKLEAKAIRTYQNPNGSGL
ncbi:MAG: cyclic nucleotide-binding domain-containing protein [Lachnospiraceae bacterium]